MDTISQFGRPRPKREIVTICVIAGIVIIGTDIFHWWQRRNLQIEVNQVAAKLEQEKQRRAQIEEELRKLEGKVDENRRRIDQLYDWLNIHFMSEIDRSKQASAQLSSCQSIIASKMITQVLIMENVANDWKFNNKIYHGFFDLFKLNMLRNKLSSSSHATRALRA